MAIIFFETLVHQGYRIL